MKWRLLKWPFLKAVVGRFSPQQPVHQSIPLDCKIQDFTLFLLSVLALVFPLNDSVVIPRALGWCISLGLMEIFIKTGTIFPVVTEYPTTVEIGLSQGLHLNPS